MENLASLLRHTRENKRLTLKDVETATRIPMVYLRVLEGGDGLMSDQVYLMPFLRTYANFLGMDTNAVVTQFVSELQRTDSRSPAFSERRVTTAVAPAVPSRLSFWALPFLLLLGVLLVGSFLWQNGLSGVETLWPTLTTKHASPPQQEKIESSPEVSFATDLPTKPPVTPSESTAPPVGAPPSTARAPSMPEGISGAAPTATSVPTQTDPAPLIDGMGHRLNIQANSPSWVRIVIDEQSPKEMILKAGESREWSAQKGFTLSFGNAGGVTLTLNGQPLPPLGKSGQVVRNVRLPANPEAPSTTTSLR